MNAIGWFFKIFTGGEAPSGTFKKVDLNFKAKHLRLRTATDAQISFNGTDTHISILAADGFQSFPDVNKGEFWYKGAGNLEVTAWDGN